MSEYNWIALRELTSHQAWDKLSDADTRLAVAIALEEALADVRVKGKPSLEHLKIDINEIDLVIPLLIRDAREALADVFCDIELEPNGQEEAEAG